MHVFAAIIFLSFSPLSLSFALERNNVVVVLYTLWIWNLILLFLSPRSAPIFHHRPSLRCFSSHETTQGDRRACVCVCWHNTEIGRKRDGENTAGMWKTAAEQDQTSRTDAPHVSRVRQKQYQVLMGMAINRFSSSFSPFHWHVEEEHAAHDGVRRNDAC